MAVMFRSNGKIAIETGVVVIKKTDSYLMTRDPDIEFGDLEFPNVVFDDDSSAKENVFAINSMLVELGVPFSLAVKRKFIKKVTFNLPHVKNTYVIEYLELNSLTSQENMLKKHTWLTEKEMKTSAVSSVTKKVLNAVKNYHRKNKKTSLTKVIDTGEVLTPLPMRKTDRTVKDNSDDDLSGVSFELIEELAILTAVKEVYNAILKKNKKLTSQNTNYGKVSDEITSELCDSVKKAQKTVNKISPSINSCFDKTSAVSDSSINIPESIKNFSQNINKNFPVTNTTFKKTLAVSTPLKKGFDVVENTNKNLPNGNNGLKRPLPVSSDWQEGSTKIKRPFAVSTDLSNENKAIKRPLAASTDIVVESEFVKSSNTNINETFQNVPSKKIKGNGMKQTSIKSFFLRK